MQSSGINTYRTLSAKLDMMHAAFGQLRHVPLTLAIYGKSSPRSSYEPFYVADLRVRNDAAAAVALQQAKQAAQAEREAGLLFEKMEEAVEAMAAASPFAIDDSETVLFTFTPGIVGREREPRQAASTPHGGTSIEAIVAEATRAGTGTPAAGSITFEKEPAVSPCLASAKIGDTEQPPTAI